jgi:hypothetical protein
MAKTKTQTEVKETRTERGWALIQVRAETHKLLKDYCEEHGFKMSALTNNIIRKYIQSN